MEKLRLDFETYSEADLIKVGPWAYSKHPSTEVLMMAWAFGDATPKLWLPGDNLPDWVHVLTIGSRDPGFQLTAWNDFFEYCIMRNVLKWTVPGPKYWADTAAKAAVLALPRGLGNCSEALGLGADKAKDKAGKKLIQIFSKPKKSAKKINKGELIRTRPEDAPELFEDFKRYCIQDVIAERTIDNLLPELQPRTRELWEIDRKINLRGVHFDMPSVDNALVTIGKAKEIVYKQVSERTSGMLENIGSRPQFLDYMEYLDVHLENAQKEYLKRELPVLEESAAECMHFDHERGNQLVEAVKMIRLRLKIARSSLAKYDKLITIIDDTNKGYGLLRFHGASTGRWSGNLFQPHNLPNESLDMPDLCIDLLQMRDPNILDMFFGDCLEAISLCLRGMLTASPGNRLVVSDFSQIESRVLAWLAGATDKLDAYRNKLDIYKVNASLALKIDYENINKDQRAIGKVIELACGYQGGIGAFRKFAKDKGVVIPDDEAKILIKNWRNGNPRITSYWSNIEALAVKAVGEPGTIQRMHNVAFKVAGTGNRSFLFCVLPSGRYIAYHKPRLVEGNYGKDQVEYWAVDAMTKKYSRQQTYGGKLVENITQATAMDCMADRMPHIEKAGYPLILSVHDELVSDTPIGHGSLAEFNRIMETVPEWAEGLPIAADGYESYRYKK